MKTSMNESMASGVYVEARDRAGNTVAQAVYTDWGSRPVPAVGDSLRLSRPKNASGPDRPLNGRVVSRHFEVQQQDDGRTSVWVALIIVVPKQYRRRRRNELSRHDRPRFSDN